MTKVGSLPNLLEGVEPEKSRKDFFWSLPDMAAKERVFVTMDITNRREGGQPCRVYFAGWNPRVNKYRVSDEVFVYLGPGETKTVSLFSKTAAVPGGRVAINMYKTELGDVSDLEVSGLKLCSIGTDE